MKIRVEHHPNEYNKTVHTTIDLFDTTLGYYSTMSGWSGRSVPAAEEPEDGKKLRQSLCSIDGIVEFSSFNRHEFSVTIGRAFDWADIEPQVLAKLQENYGAFERLPDILAPLPRRDGYYD